MSCAFKRASLALTNNAGNLYEKNYSLVLKVNPRWTNTTLISKRNNANNAKKDSKPQEEPKGTPYKKLTIGVPRETYQNERRVALTPTATQNLAKKGFNLIIEENAGILAKFPNDQYEKAGAKIADSKSVYSSSDIILKVRSPDLNEIRNNIKEYVKKQYETRFISKHFV